MICPSLKPPFVEGMAQPAWKVSSTSCAQVAAARPLPRRSRWRKSNLSNSLSSRWKAQEIMHFLLPSNGESHVKLPSLCWTRTLGIVIYSGQLDFWGFLRISGHLFIRNHQTTRLCSNCGMVFTESQHSTWRISLISLEWNGGVAWDIKWYIICIYYIYYIYTIYILYILYTLYILYSIHIQIYIHIYIERERVLM